MMADTIQLHTLDKRLSITREAELLQSFVRINVGEDEGADESRSQIADVKKEEKPETTDDGKTKRGSADDGKKADSQTHEVRKKGSGFGFL